MTETISLQEQKELLHRIRIRHAFMIEGENKILNVINRSKITTEPKSLIIFGDAGTGKTILFKQFVKKNDNVRIVQEGNKKVIKRKVLAVQLPYPATVQGTIARMLIALGDDFPDSGKTTEAKTRRLVNFIKMCGVEVIMIDEFQNMVDKDKEKTLKGAAEWIKNLINDTQLPFVFFGTPNSIDILGANEGQLNRRVEYIHEMKSYGFSTAEEQHRFYQLLNRIDEKLPFPERSLFHEPEMALRIYKATKGLMFAIMSLITDAAEYALDKGAKNVQLVHLEQSYLSNRYLYGRELILENPFEADYLDQFQLQQA